MYYFGRGGYSGGSYACVGAGNIWETLISSSQFCNKPKNAPKNKVFFKARFYYYLQAFTPFEI